MREPDATTVVVPKTEEEAGQVDEEVQWDINNDEFKDYFAKSYQPKVLITSADNPHSVKKYGVTIVVMQFQIPNPFSIFHAGVSLSLKI